MTNSEGDTMTTHTAKLYTKTLHNYPIEEPVLNYYEVGDAYVPKGPFATLDEALAFAKADMQAFTYTDQVKHSRAFINQRRITKAIDMRAYEQQLEYNAEINEMFSPCAGDTISTIEVFLSNEELANLAAGN